MSYLFKVSEAKKADDADIISSMLKLSEILYERRINDLTMDEDDVVKELLSSDCFSDARNIKDVYVINNSMIGIPSIPPQNNARGDRVNGNHVIPIVDVPGIGPYQAYIAGTETWVETGTVNLRGPRRVHIHRVIPGMVVSYHHYQTREGRSDRVAIDAFRLDYDEDYNIVVVPVPEKDALIQIPDEETVPKKKGF